MRVIELLEGRDKKVRAAKIWVLSSERKPVTLRCQIQSLIPRVHNANNKRECPTGIGSLNALRQ